MSWQVTSQQQTVSRTGPGGSTIDVIRVYFDTDTGYQGYVDVPTSDYSSPGGPDIVRGKINAAVAQHNAVASLSSE